MNRYLQNSTERDRRTNANSRDMNSEANLTPSLTTHYFPESTGKYTQDNTIVRKSDITN
jgi:hypothetical protein